MTGWQAKILSHYKTTAIMAFNVGLLLLVLNGLCYIALGLVDQKNPVWWKYGSDNWNLVYPGKSSDEINDMLRETWTQVTQEYEPFTQFREITYAGRFVNVSPQGFRNSEEQGSWPITDSNYNIFLFGGSTLFGYGVSDKETVASFLQAKLSKQLSKPVRVYNFGRGSYYSSQELALFTRLLAKGHVPNAAMFIDGLNDFRYRNDQPEHTRRLSKLMEGESATIRFLQSLALVRALNKLVAPENTTEEKDDAAEPTAAQVAQRYLRTKKIIEAVAQDHGIETVFVWQPSPIYKYDLKYHLFADETDRIAKLQRFGGYPYMDQLRNSQSLGSNFLWTADMHEQLKEPLYVDVFHYSAKMSEMLADKIVSMVVGRQLLTEKGSGS